MRGSRRGSVSVFEGVVLAFGGAIVFAALSPEGAFNGDWVDMSVPFWLRVMASNLQCGWSACLVVDRSAFAPDLSRLQP
jgi:hypothetical protein